MATQFHIKSIHLVGKEKEAGLMKLRRSTVGWHVEFMALHAPVHALSNQTAACEFVLTRQKIFCNSF